MTNHLTTFSRVDKAKHANRLSMEKRLKDFAASPLIVGSGGALVINNAVFLVANSMSIGTREEPDMMTIQKAAKNPPWISSLTQHTSGNSE